VENEHVGYEIFRTIYNVTLITLGYTHMNIDDCKKCMFRVQTKVNEAKNVGHSDPISISMSSIHQDISNI